MHHPFRLAWTNARLPWRHWRKIWKRNVKRFARWRVSKWQEQVGCYVLSVPRLDVIVHHLNIGKVLANSSFLLAVSLPARGVELLGSRAKTFKILYFEYICRRCGLCRVSRAFLPAHRERAGPAAGVLPDGGGLPSPTSAADGRKGGSRAASAAAGGCQGQQWRATISWPKWIK